MMPRRSCANSIGQFVAGCVAMATLATPLFKLHAQEAAPSAAASQSVRLQAPAGDLPATQYVKIEGYSAGFCPMAAS